MPISQYPFLTPGGGEVNTLPGSIPTTRAKPSRSRGWRGNRWIGPAWSVRGRRRVPRCATCHHQTGWYEMIEKCHTSKMCNRCCIHLFWDSVQISKLPPTIVLFFCCQPVCECRGVSVQVTLMNLPYKTASYDQHRDITCHVGWMCPTETLKSLFCLVAQLSWQVLHTSMYLVQLLHDLLSIDMVYNHKWEADTHKIHIQISALEAY